MLITVQLTLEEFDKVRAVLEHKEEPKIKMADLIVAAKRVINAAGPEKVTSIVAKYGATSVNALKEQDWTNVMKDFEEVCK